ncbi:MAG: hypothetical protein JJ863_26790 [Deltaproteobacteria bacterium]|nr:hypothetical protein [Deltaproteobacteria bacterium]
MARFLTLALTLTLASTASAQTGVHPAPEAPVGNTITAVAPPSEPIADEAPSRFQAGFSVLGVADFIGAGNGDEIIDIPSYGGVGVDVHVGALLHGWNAFNGHRFSLLAGYRGNAEHKWGFEGVGITNDSFTQRHQAYIAFAGGSTEIAIGGGAVFTTLMGGGADTFTGRGGSVLAELRAGTRSGFTVSIGMNGDFYTDLVRGDGSKVRAINLFFGVGWKTL